MADDDLDRVPSEPLDQRRVNRAVFAVEDAWWLIGPIAAVKRYRLVSVAMVLGLLAILRPDIASAILGAVK
jgi:hypothetical protein